MKILLAILHYWDPDGDGHHQSLRPNPAPRICALQDQIRSFLRLGMNRSFLHMTDRAAYPADQDLRHHIDIHIVTDGHHHVLDSIDQSLLPFVRHIVTEPSSGRYLGFEVQRHLASQLESGYDLYGYVEDDLIISDPLFFWKIFWFQRLLGEDNVLSPQRVEFSNKPGYVDRFYIDGPLPQSERESLSMQTGPVIVSNILDRDIVFETPLNPHAGCFFLTNMQLAAWTKSPTWLDMDSSFISPLESSATLGLSRTFKVYKPAITNASWLEIQHWGIGFHSLLH